MAPHPWTVVAATKGLFPSGRELSLGGYFVGALADDAVSAAVAAAVAAAVDDVIAAAVSAAAV